MKTSLFLNMGEINWILQSPKLQWSDIPFWYSSVINLNSIKILKYFHHHRGIFFSMKGTSDYWSFETQRVQSMSPIYAVKLIFISNSKCISLLIGNKLDEKHVKMSNIVILKTWLYDIFFQFYILTRILKYNKF